MKQALYLFVFLATPCIAQESEPPDRLFQDHSTLAVRITAPFTTLIREKPDEEDLQGTFSYVDDAGETVSFDIKIRARGHSRQTICQLPPLWLNFKKSQVKGTLFRKQNKLKLSVHCANSLRYEQTVLREYMAYRILNAITPLSFNVRLLKVTYVDSDAGNKEQERHAFLLEHKNRLGKRLDRKDLKIDETTVADLQGDHLNLTSLFQFMIANTDFSPIAPSPYNECCHNYVLFGNDEDPIVAIPYDFDQSGIVNAPYATPGEQFALQSVRQRLYRGRCENNEHIDANLQRILDARGEIEAMIASQEGASDTTKKALAKFVRDFYKIIENPNNKKKRIDEKCIEPAA